MEYFDKSNDLEIQTLKPVTYYLPTFYYNIYIQYIYEWFKNIAVSHTRMHIHTRTHAHTHIYLYKNYFKGHKTCNKNLYNYRYHFHVCLMIQTHVNIISNNTSTNEQYVIYLLKFHKFVLNLIIY